MKLRRQGQTVMVRVGSLWEESQTGPGHRYGQSSQFGGEKWVRATVLSVMSRAPYNTCAEVADDEAEESEQRGQANYNQDADAQDDGEDEEAVDDEDKVIYRVHVQLLDQPT